MVGLVGSKSADEKGDARHEKAGDGDRRVDVRRVGREGHLPCPLYFLRDLKLPSLRRPLPIEVFFLIALGCGVPVSERFAIGVGVAGG